MNYKKIAILLGIIALIVAFFAFDLGRYFSLSSTILRKLGT